MIPQCWDSIYKKIVERQPVLCFVLAVEFDPPPRPAGSSSRESDSTETTATSSSIKLSRNGGKEAKKEQVIRLPLANVDFAAMSQPEKEQLETSISDAVVDHSDLAPENVSRVLLSAAELPNDTGTVAEVVLEQATPDAAAKAALTNINRAISSQKISLPLMTNGIKSTVVVKKSATWGATQHRRSITIKPGSRRKTLKCAVETGSSARSVHQVAIEGEAATPAIDTALNTPEIDVPQHDFADATEVADVCTPSPTPSESPQTNATHTSGEKAAVTVTVQRKSKPAPELSNTPKRLSRSEMLARALATRKHTPVGFGGINGVGVLVNKRSVAPPGTATLAEIIAEKDLYVVHLQIAVRSIGFSFHELREDHPELIIPDSTMSYPLALFEHLQMIIGAEKHLIRSLGLLELSHFKKASTVLLSTFKTIKAIYLEVYARYSCVACFCCCLTCTPCIFVKEKGTRHPVELHCLLKH